MFRKQGKLQVAMSENCWSNPSLSNELCLERTKWDISLAGKALGS